MSRTDERSEDAGKLIPYLVSPDQTVPGVSTYYATLCRECVAACSVISETRDGRVIKLEGNPDAPLKALIFDSWYDPYRGVVILTKVIDGVMRPGQKMSCRM